MLREEVEQAGIGTDFLGCTFQAATGVPQLLKIAALQGTLQKFQNSKDEPSEQFLLSFPFG